MELVTTNYLGGPLDWHEIEEDVRTAITKPSVPKNVSRLSLEETEIYYGVEVTEFVMQYARELGLWTGKYPDNKRTAGIKDRCSIM